jgi:hypothetical protein
VTTAAFVGRPSTPISGESFELAAYELFLALVDLDLKLRFRGLVCRGDKADPLVFEFGLAPLALPLLALELRPAHAVPPFADAKTG